LEYRYHFRGLWALFVVVIFFLPYIPIDSLIYIITLPLLMAAIFWKLLRSTLSAISYQKAKR
jgi:hypothetical protein